MKEISSLELSNIQEKLFKNLLWVVPVFLGIITTAILPLSIWLVQNAYMAQATAILVREMAIDIKGHHPENCGRLFGGGCSV